MLKEYLVEVCNKRVNGKKNCDGCPANDLCHLFPVKFEEVNESLLQLAVRDYLRVYCSGFDTRCGGCLCKDSCIKHVGFSRAADFSKIPEEGLIEFLKELFENAKKPEEKPVTAQEVWEFMKQYILNSDEINMSIYPEMMGQTETKSFFDVYSPEEAIRRWRNYQAEQEKKEFQPYEIILVDGVKYIFMEYADEEKTRIHTVRFDSIKMACNAGFTVKDHHIQSTGIILDLEELFK